MEVNAMYMLVMVLDDSTRLNQVLQGWIAAGVPGVTILESTGVNRVLPRDSASPSYAGFAQMFGSGRVGHDTLFAVIDDLEIAEAAVRQTEEILGDLNKPHTGIVFALPVAKTWGLPEPYSE
jgi:hypothetical protein